MTLKYPIRIVIIEDDEIIRSGYSYLLGAVDGYEVVNGYASYEDAASSIVNDVPDVILLDVQLPGLSGIEAIPRLRQKVPDAVVIILTVHEDAELIYSALSNGALGYLTKNVSSEKIIEAINETVTGGGALSANVARYVIQSFQKNPNTPLTKRETEVLQLIADGKSRGRVAKELFVDVETVRTHIKNVYLKLNVHSRADAIKNARDNKFIR